MRSSSTSINTTIQQRRWLPLSSHEDDDNDDDKHDNIIHVVPAAAAAGGGGGRVSYPTANPFHRLVGLDNHNDDNDVNNNEEEIDNIITNNNELRCRETWNKKNKHLRSIDSFLEECYNFGGNDHVNKQSQGETLIPNKMMIVNNKRKRSLLPPPSSSSLSFWFIMLSLAIANSSDASEILCLSYILSDSTFQTNMLHNNASKYGGLLAGSVFFGMLLGGLIVGALGDDLGRKNTLLFGLLLNCTAGISSCGAPNVLVLSLIRTLAGLGIGATVPPLFALTAELSPPSRRGLCVTVVASFWMVGSVYVAIMGLLCFRWLNWTWRIFALWCAIPSALGAVLVAVMVPESPRFLAINGRYEECIRVVNDLAMRMSFGGRLMVMEEIRYHYNRIRTSHRYRDGTSRRSNPVGALMLNNSDSEEDLSLQTCREIMQRGKSDAVREVMSDIIRSTLKLYAPHVRRVTIPLQIIWFSLCFGSYGLTTWINSLFVEVHLDDIYWNALLFALSNLPGNVISGLFIDTVGRRNMLVGSMMAAALSLVSFAYYAAASNSGGKVNATGIVLSACAFQAFTISGWNAIDVMTGESFPTSVRSTGMGVCAASGRVAAMLAQFVNGALVKQPVLLLLIASLALFIGAVAPCLVGGEDMSKRPLEDDVTKDHLSDEEEDEEEKSIRPSLSGFDNDSDARYSRDRELPRYSSLESGRSDRTENGILLI